MRDVLTNRFHNWSLPLDGGPNDIGFDYSAMVPEGVARAPFAFIRNNYLVPDESEIVYWNPGTYDMPHGKSTIMGEGLEGDGDQNWDSTAFNMIVVNETIAFLDQHMQTQHPDTPFFSYVALGAVHLPHSPPDKYIDGSPVAGQYPSKHMDLLGEVDKVVGSLVEALAERNQLEDTIIIFTSDNGGLNFKKKNSTLYDSSGLLRGSKGTSTYNSFRTTLSHMHTQFF